MHFDPPLVCSTHFLLHAILLYHPICDAHKTISVSHNAPPLQETFDRLLRLLNLPAHSFGHTPTLLYRQRAVGSLCFYRIRIHLLDKL